MPRLVFMFVCIVFLCFTPVTMSSNESGTIPEVPQHDVIPVMLLRCAACHGARTQSDSWSVTSRAELLRGGKSGPAIIPGNPVESLLLQKVYAGEMSPRKRLIEIGTYPPGRELTEV